jgi:hypothetical protein
MHIPKQMTQIKMVGLVLRLAIQRSHDQLSFDIYICVSTKEEPTIIQRTASSSPAF